VPIDKLTLKVNFDFDKYNIKKEFDPELQKAVEFVKKYPTAIFTLDGHTDYIGTKKYNQKLSEKRANSVLKYLTSKGGFDKARFTVNGFGKTKPIADNKTKKGRAENRRVELAAFSK
jgi:OOP family OmpA-OmpF porin